MLTTGGGEPRPVAPPVLAKPPQPA